MSSTVRTSILLLVALVCMASLVHALVPINGAPGTDRRKSFKVADITYAIDDSVDVSVIDDAQIITPGNVTGEMTTTQLTATQTTITTTTNGILWRGGNLLNNSPKIFLIFYGNFAGSTTPQIMIDLAQNQSGAPLHTISRTYWTKTKPVGQTAYAYSFADTDPVYGGAYFDTSYTYGTSLTDTSVLNIITAAAKKSAFGSTSLLANAVYFVITSADVAETGLCTKFCGWHTAAQVGTAVIHYAYLGSPLRCPNSCSRAMSIYPNDNREADGLANTFMHELVESITSPELATWSDTSYLENADKCAWQFGTTYTAPNGGMANCKLGNRHFLIQQNWLNYGGGSCKSSWSG